MKRRKNVIRQAGIYLLLLVISPFICAALVRAVSEPIEMLTETAQTTVGMTVDNITADSISADRESSSYTESIYTEKTIPKENTFRIITDDSFIKPYGGLHIPSADNEDSEAFAPPEIAPGEADESLEYPGTDGTVDIVTYGKMSGSDYIDIGGGQLRNMTEFSAETILTTAEKMSFTPLLRDGTPEILIYHTHATESYLPAASDVYDTNFPFRSTDKSINMVA
ncbi:MAG: stage II sporulation protein P, partial [Ruminococcus sp.]|nr:stage II sporulation protein P [Ruminococcus sp.]